VPSFDRLFRELQKREEPAGWLAFRKWPEGSRTDGDLTPYYAKIYKPAIPGACSAM
jgi:hypothetical protein